MGGMKRVGRIIGLIGGAAAVLWAMRDRLISIAAPAEPEPPRFRVVKPPPDMPSTDSVTDDLDSHPPTVGNSYTAGFYGAASFHWFIASPDTDGALVPMPGHQLSDYLLDVSAYAPGDQLTLRVEIDDRIGRDIVCAPDAPTCALSNNTECRQRVTWDLEVR